MTVSACNQDESTTGAATVCSVCARAITGRTTMATADRNLTIRTSKGGTSCFVPRSGAPFATKRRSRSGSPRPGNDVGLHPGLREPEDEQRVTQRIAELEVTTRRHGDELLAVELVHRGGGVHTGAAVELPKDGTGLGVVCLEPAVALAGEHQAAGRGGRAAHHRQLGLLLPGDLAGVEVDRADGSVFTRVAALLVRYPHEGAPEPEPALLPGGVVDLVVHRLMQAYGVRVGQIRMHGDRDLPYAYAVGLHQP